MVAPPRQLPSVKDTAWPSERSKWQALVPPEASEGLLCDAEGCVLEGFVTNFFAVGALLIRTCAAGGRVCTKTNCAYTGKCAASHAFAACYVPHNEWRGPLHNALVSAHVQRDSVVDYRLPEASAPTRRWFVCSEGWRVRPRDTAHRPRKQSAGWCLPNTRDHGGGCTRL